MTLSVFLILTGLFLWLILPGWLKPKKKRERKPRKNPENKLIRNITLAGILLVAIGVLGLVRTVFYMFA